MWLLWAAFAVLHFEMLAGQLQEDVIHLLTHLRFLPHRTRWRAGQLLLLSIQSCYWGRRAARRRMSNSPVSSRHRPKNTGTKSRPENSKHLRNTSSVSASSHKALHPDEAFRGKCFCISFKKAALWKLNAEHQREPGNTEITVKKVIFLSLNAMG